jgi:hypothetical protein
VNDYDLDSLRLLARQKHEQRLREAGAERLARVLRGTWQRRRLRWQTNPAGDVSRGAHPRRLETSTGRRDDQ